jgi:hypothetical protein
MVRRGNEGNGGASGDGDDDDDPDEAQLDGGDDSDDSPCNTPLFVTLFKACLVSQKWGRTKTF